MSRRFDQVEWLGSETLAIRVSAAAMREQAAALFRDHPDGDCVEREIDRDYMRFGCPPEEFGMEFERGYYTPAKPGRGAWEVWLLWTAR